MRASNAHPGKMLPAIARHAIATWTRPGDLVLDPMAGIGTTIVEAQHLGRHGVGVEYEPRWVQLAAENIALATRHGATGTGQIWSGDSRRLSPLIPAEIRGNVDLVITSPPYGPYTHGHIRAPGPKTGKINRFHRDYGNTPGNLANADPDELATGFTDILTECAGVLRREGILVITARPYRRGRELVDIPGMAIAAATHAGFHLIDRCPALIAAVRNGRLTTRASFFQQKNIRTAHSAGDPQWLIAHEDVLAFSVLPIARSNVVARLSGSSVIDEKETFGEAAA